MNQREKLTYRTYLKVAAPIIISHGMNQLLGITDLAIVGTRADIMAMAGICIALGLISTYDIGLWFLRVGATKSSEKALQDGNEMNQAKALLQHISLGFIIGCTLVLFKGLAWNLVMKVYNPNEVVMSQGKIYYDIVMMGMPLLLMNHAIIGWLMGKGKARDTRMIQIGANILNVVFNVLFMKKDEMGLVAVAYSTLCVQLICFVVGMGKVWIEENSIRKYILNLSVWYPKNMSHNFEISKAIGVKVLCIAIINNAIITMSCHMGYAILIVNTILLQLKGFMSYFFEGIASATSIFIARGIKEKDYELLKEVHTMTLPMIMYTGLGLVLLYQLERTTITGHLTQLVGIKRLIRSYDGWLVIYPIIDGWGMSSYGLYIGTWQTKIIGYANFVGLVIFALVCALMVPILDNHGIWMALIAFYLVRTIILMAYEGTLHGILRFDLE